MKYLISFITIILITGTARAELYDTFMNPIKMKSEAEPVAAECVVGCQSGICKLVKKTEKSIPTKSWGIIRWERAGLFRNKPIYGWIQKSGVTKTAKTRIIRTGRT